MKNKKATLITIIFLLIIFLPLTILGTITHFKNTQEGKNLNFDFKQEGKLYFYKGEELLGTYTCLHAEGYCDYAISKLTTEYSLEEYQSDSTSKLSLINNQYAFLFDTTTEKLQNAEVILYDALDSKVLANFKEVKNYGIGLENNRYILKNENDLWGVMEFNQESFNISIPFIYDYIGVVKEINADTGKIVADKFAVKKEGLWQVIDSKGNDLSIAFPEEIVSFTEETIILKGEGYRKYVDYEGTSLLSNTLKHIALYEPYLEIIDDKNHFYLYDEATKEKISKEYVVADRSDISLSKEAETIIIRQKDNIVETIPIK